MTKLVVIGTSAGGISVLKDIFLTLPQGFKLPVIVVQHFGVEASGSLHEFFSDFSVLKVKEAEDKEPIQGGTIYFAPAGYHLLVGRDARFHLSVEEPVFYCRPSIDVLFETAAESWGAGVTGVILTGANEDGARGLEAVVKHGGKALIQDPGSAEFPMMPKEALKRVPNPDFLGEIRGLSRILSGL